MQNLQNVPITGFKGIGEKTALLYAKVGIRTVYDMLFYFPRAYKDFSQLTPCIALKEGEACVAIRLSATPQLNMFLKNKSQVTATGHDETGRVNIVFFNQPYRKNSLKAGQTYLVTGTVHRQGRGMSFSNPEMELIDSVAAKGIVPIYPISSGIGQKSIRNLANQCVEYLKLNPLEETMDDELLSQLCIIKLNDAIMQLHSPTDFLKLDQAKKRISIDNSVNYMIMLELLSPKGQRDSGIAHKTGNLIQQFCKLIPFELTDAQKRALAEIEGDMGKNTAMNRLVQGDVGSGKTMAALYCMYVAVQNGNQAAMMAPTEILARQHYDTIVKIFKENARVCLLVGSLTKKQKDAAHLSIEQGNADIVIGTHAIISQGVKFKNLSAIVTDEQHRFGVCQRAKLGAKGQTVDTLVMSATPIPRTLALILYADLDVTIIDQLPPGRKPIKTSFVPIHKRADMYQYIATQAQKGIQSYVVCPLIEESEAVDAKSAEEVFFELSTTIMANIPIALLHGRLNYEEKQAVLSKFKQGQTKVLVATTVIEVGVDVPNAGIIAIEGADRFGLAQLHQLRGRVGRSSMQSYCFLLTGNESTNPRINVLCKTNDGFIIAQKDLDLRGAGEFLGTAQSGDTEFLNLVLTGDVAILKQAREVAKRILTDTKFEKYKKQHILRANQMLDSKLGQIVLN